MGCGAPRHVVGVDLGFETSTIGRPPPLGFRSVRTITPTDLTLRRLLGFFLPGFAWLLLALLTVTALPQAASPITDWLGANPLALGLAVLVLAFLLGAAAASLSLRLAATLGDLVDFATSTLSRGKLAKRIIGFISDRLHILDTVTIGQRHANVARMLQASVPLLPVLPNDPPSWRGRIYKLYILTHSRELARQALDLEADINLYAGLWLPALLLAFWLRGQHEAGLALTLFLIAPYLALRTQYLRHKEVETIAASYVILRTGAGVRPAAENETPAR